MRLWVSHDTVTAVPLLPACFIVKENLSKQEKLRSHWVHLCRTKGLVSIILSETKDAFCLAIFCIMKNCVQMKVLISFLMIWKIKSKAGYVANNILVPKTLKVDQELDTVH